MRGVLGSPFLLSQNPDSSVAFLPDRTENESPAFPSTTTVPLKDQDREATCIALTPWSSLLQPIRTQMYCLSSPLLEFYLENPLHWERQTAACPKWTGDLSAIRRLGVRKATLTPSSQEVLVSFSPPVLPEEVSGESRSWGTEKCVGTVFRVPKSRWYIIFFSVLWDLVMS